MGICCPGRTHHSPRIMNYSRGIQWQTSPDKLIFMCITPWRCIRERAQYILTLNTRQTSHIFHTVFTPTQWWGSCVMSLSDTERRVDIEPLHKRLSVYRGAGKSLARPGRKQARKHVRDARDFNNIETRAVIKFFFFPARHRKNFHAILTETLACFLPGRSKDLSSPL